MADAASVGSDAGSIRHVRTLISVRFEVPFFRGEKMRSHLQFTIGFIFTMTFAVAIFLAKEVSIWILLLSTEAFLILMVVGFLFRGIPASLYKASRDNCYRIDGSISQRREARERAAKLKIRSDLFAILLIVALSGNLLAFAIHSLVIPLPVATETLTLFSFDTNSWRDAIRERNLDRQYSEWVAIEHAGNSRIDPNQHFVKATFPVVVCAALAWLVGSFTVVWYAYLSTMREFNAGIKSRFTEYLNLDIGRMQTSEPVNGSRKHHSSES